MLKEMKAELLLYDMNDILINGWLEYLSVYRLMHVYTLYIKNCKKLAGPVYFCVMFMWVINQQLHFWKLYNAISVFKNIILWK